MKKVTTLELPFTEVLQHDTFFIAGKASVKKVSLSESGSLILILEQEQGSFDDPNLYSTHLYFVPTGSTVSPEIQYVDSVFMGNLDPIHIYQMAWEV